MNNDTSIRPYSRRSFIRYVSGLAAGAGLMGASGAPLLGEGKKNLYDPLTKEEEKAASESAMVREIVTLPEKGFSCAGAILTASLKHMKKPEYIADAAAAFGGGMGHKDLCGLLTGGIMAIGVSAGRHYQERKKIKAYARQLTQEYWKWWESYGPLHCRQLRSQYDRQGFYNMLKRAALKIEELIDRKKESE